MKGKEIIILSSIGIASFMLGIGVHIGYVWLAEEPTGKNEDMKITEQPEETYSVAVRINDGYVEWSDGTKWHREESVEQLEMQDPYNFAKEALNEFEENYRIELENENQLAIEEEKTRMKAPMVGTEKTTVDSKETSKKKGSTNSENTGKTQSGDTDAASSNQTVTPSGTSQGTGSSQNTGSSQDTSVSQGTGSSQSTSGTQPETTTPETPAQPETPATPAQPETPTTPTQPETPTTPDSGTGDGEDIGWSDDYL